MIAETSQVTYFIKLKIEILVKTYTIVMCFCALSDKNVFSCTRIIISIKYILFLN